MNVSRLLLLLVVAAAFPAAALAAPAGQARPVIVMKTSNLGNVLATPKRLGLYTWDTEKAANGKVKCVGSCAVSWPPVLVGARDTIPARTKGTTARLGTIKRPDGKTQLTVNGLPAYTYVGDRANLVLCDNVDGWHAIRA